MLILSVWREEFPSHLQLQSDTVSPVLCVICLHVEAPEQFNLHIQAAGIFTVDAVVLHSAADGAGSGSLTRLLLQRQRSVL